MLKMPQPILIQILHLKFSTIIKPFWDEVKKEKEKGV